MRLGTAIECLVDNYKYASDKEWINDKVAWALYHTWKEADRKTENSSGKPNNCEHITEDGVTCAKYPACDDCLDNPLNKVKGSERLVKGSDESQPEPSGYKTKPVEDEPQLHMDGYYRKDEPTISKMEQVDKDINVRSKDEPTTQTETQNSNLTFKTLEYCDICDHKGCKECIANALDEHCIPSQFKKQIEDECAKEYEELGLKELKELIKADRKDEPQKDCKKCKNYDRCKNNRWKCCVYQPKDEPQTDYAWR